jgi:ankyrin repeat protein
MPSASRTNLTLALMRNAVCVSVLTQLFEENPDCLLALDEDGHSVLHYAIVKNNMDACAWLLNAAPELINKVDAHRQTPIFQACAAGHSDILCMLLGRGGDVHARDVKGLTCAQMCLNADCLRIVTDHSIDLLEQDLRGRNALWTNCEQGRVECVQFMLERPEAKSMLASADIYGETPVHIAAKNGHLEVLQRLRRKLWRALLLQTNDEGETAEQLATRFQHTNCAALLQTLAPTTDEAVHDETLQGGVTGDSGVAVTHQHDPSLGEWVQHFDQGKWKAVIAHLSVFSVRLEMVRVHLSLFMYFLLMLGN